MLGFKSWGDSNHLFDPQEFNAHLWNFGRHGAVRCLARWIFITFVFLVNLPKVYPESPIESMGTSTVSGVSDEDFPSNPKIYGKYM